MQASELLSSSILTLHPDSDGQKALSLMDDLKISHLPVVQNKSYLGIISENEILEWEKTDESIDKHLSNLVAPHVLENQHLFDIIEVLEKNHLTIVPVLTENKQYMGSISNRKLLYTIARSSTVQSVGGVFVLEMNQNNYSMSEIARIIESNNAKILSSYITSAPNSTKMELTIKVNKIDIDAIINDFERFEYKVMASYQESASNDDVMEKYESLMRFLNP
jgi:predicted transcriptional regulator|tara:strand:- start:50 stop:712 length:663 start_codon:yes stop_codon:yes gene_type:complete